jgi:hypothetical protein
VEDLRPFLDLAREIKREVERIAADDTADIDQLSDAIDQFPLAERRRVALAVFHQLPPDVQWAILERVFGDVEIRSYLEDEHRRRGEQMGRSGRRLALAEAARSTRMLDTRELAEGDEVTVGLFREPEVRSATTRGHESDTCARSIVLRCVGPGELRVIDDVFNPRGGYFVTRDYDAATWVLDRFASHDVIRIGAVTDDAEGPALEPVVYLGARADFEHDGAVIRGTLHVGFVMLDGIDVFAGRS